MIEKDKEAFERYVESRPEYYFGLSKYDKAHDLQVWLDATKWERMSEIKIPKKIEKYERESLDL